MSTMPCDMRRSGLRSARQANGLAYSPLHTVLSGGLIPPSCSAGGRTDCNPFQGITVNAKGQVIFHMLHIRCMFLPFNQLLWLKDSPLSNWTVHDMCVSTVDLVGHVLLVLGCKNEVHTWRHQRYATVSSPPTQSEHSMPFRAIPFRVILQCWHQTVDGACNNTSDMNASQASAFAPFS